MAQLRPRMNRAAILGVLAAATGWILAGSQSSSAQTGQTSTATKAPAKRPTPSASAGTAAPLENQTAVTQAWKLFTDSEAETKLLKRTAALLALGNAGDRPEVVHMLGKAMVDTHPEVRRAAAAALGLARVHSMIPRLQKALDDPSPSVRVAAARSLWQMKDYSGSGLFERIVSGQAPSEEKGMRQEVHHAMAKASDPSYIFVMGLHEGAGAFLGPYALVIPVYTYLSTDKTAPGRAAVAALLGERHTDEAIAALEIGLVDTSAVVRAASAIALGKSERAEEITQLAPLLHDRKQVVRLAAAAAVVRLSPTGSGGK